jgi:hypothetical protein
MFQNIFKKEEPRKFNYKSPYYNQKEAEIRKQKILDGEEDTQVHFGDRFREKVKENRKIKQNSIKKIGIMLALLIILLYILITI